MGPPVFRLSRRQRRGLGAAGSFWWAALLPPDAPPPLLSLWMKRKRFVPGGPEELLLGSGAWGWEQ